MNRILKYIIPIIILCTSCREIFFDEETESREVMLTEFNAVVIRGIYNIILVQDSANKLVIAGKNNISSIETHVSNDTLVIVSGSSFSLNPARNTLELHFSNINYIYTSQPVNISVKDTIRADLFSYIAVGEIEEADIRVNCNYLIIFGGHNTLGKFTVSGRTYFADLSARYGASIDAKRLDCSEAEVYSASAGDIYVNVSRRIKSYLNGTGNIYYYGNPIIEIPEHFGDGRMINLK